MNDKGHNYREQVQFLSVSGSFGGSVSVGNQRLYPHQAMIDFGHGMAVLATSMPWAEIESRRSLAFAHHDRTGRMVEGADLYSPTVALVGAGISPAGRTILPMRLMVAVLYLRRAFNLNDDTVIERWERDVYFQFFRGHGYFETLFPATKLTSTALKKAWVQPTCKSCS